jgi:hypothetical protein
MGFAKYYEDNQEISYERMESFARHSIAAESANIERKLADLESTSNRAHEKIEIVQNLQWQRTVINYRINLSLTAGGVESDHAVSVVTAYRRKLEGMRRQLDDRLARLPGGHDTNAKIVKVLGPQEKESQKQTLILQIIDLLLQMLLRNSETPDEIQTVVLADIKKLAGWYGSAFQFGSIQSKTIDNDTLKSFCEARLNTDITEILCM